MEKYYIGPDQRKFKQKVENLKAAVRVVNDVKPLFVREDLPFTLKNIKDYLSGAHDIEKQLFTRLENDVKNIKIRSLRISLRQEGKAGINRFLSTIRAKLDNVIPGFDIVGVPRLALEDFEHFELDKQKILKLKAGYQVSIRIACKIYTENENQIRFLKALESACQFLNEAKEIANQSVKPKEHWQFPNSFSLDHAFKKAETGFYSIDKFLGNGSF